MHQLIAFALCLWTGGAMAQGSLQDRFIAHGKGMVGLLDAELACGPSVIEAKWSHDGRFVMAVCRAARIGPGLAKSRALTRDPGDPPGDLLLEVWSRDSHLTREVWRRPLAGSRVEEFRWLPGSEKAVAIVRETEPSARGRQIRRVLWIRASTGPARVVTDIPPEPEEPGWIHSPFNYIDLSTVRPIAIIVTGSTRQRILQLTNGTTRTMHASTFSLTPIRDDGALGETLRLPEDVSPSVWTEDGSAKYLSHIEMSTDPKGRAVFTYFEYDPRAGRVRQLPGEPPDYLSLLESQGSPASIPTLDSRVVRLTSTSIDLSPGVTVRPLWMEAPKDSNPSIGVNGENKSPNVPPVPTLSRSKVLVCPDATWSQLSPTGDAVLYFHHEAAWVRPLLQVTAKEYDAMVREEARRQTVADAEALSKALLNLVGDAEYLPRADKLRDQLRHYVKENPDLLDRIVYTADGGVGLGLPPDTRLGYVPGPGGRAVIFADGSAKWEDDRPQPP